MVIIHVAVIQDFKSSSGGSFGSLRVRFGAELGPGPKSSPSGCHRVAHLGDVGLIRCHACARSEQSNGALT